MKYKDEFGLQKLKTSSITVTWESLSEILISSRTLISEFINWSLKFSYQEKAFHRHCDPKPLALKISEKKILYLLTKDVKNQVENLKNQMRKLVFQGKFI